MTRSATRLWGALGISVLTAGLCADRPVSHLHGHQPQIPLAAQGPTGTGVAAGRVVDPTTNAPIANAIVWQSRITAPICDRLKAEGHEATFRKKTGLVVDAYFSGTKIKHLLDSFDGLRDRAARGGRA